MLKINPDSIQAHYERLNQIGLYQETADQGFHRPAYSDAETQSMIYIQEDAERAGLATRWDAVGNLVVEIVAAEQSKTYASWVETGSHMDTVMGGGNYDGVAGVVAGLEVLKAAQQSQVALKHGLRLRVWRGEESSSFGTASLGAWAAVGKLSPVTLERSYEGVTLSQAMNAQQADPSMIQHQQPSMSQAELDGITAHIELHIEQGNVLEKQNKAIGVVTGIRGSIRRWVRISGAFDHSGATPMGKTYRKDANLAMAFMMVELDKLLDEFNEGEAKVVQTFGAVNSHGNHNQRFPLIHENAVSKVSGFAYFSFEIRSCDVDVAKVYDKRAQSLLYEVAQSFGVNVDVELISESVGIPTLDSHIQDNIVQTCEMQQLSYTHLASGAWHDVAVLSHQQKSDGNPIPTGLIFIPCKQGVSHSADEYASPEHIAAGADVLAQVMTSL